MRLTSIFAASAMFAASLGGCAASGPASVQLVVGPGQMARLAPNVTAPLLDAHANAVRDLDNEEQHGNDRLAKARATLTAVQAEPPGAMPEVHAAKIERARAELAWQQAFVREITWRRAAEKASFERDKAALLYHTGSDIDLEPFKDQAERARVGLREQDATQIAARTRFEAADQRLTAAKSRYVQGLRASAKP